MQQTGILLRKKEKKETGLKSAEPEFEAWICHTLAALPSHLRRNCED